MVENGRQRRLLRVLALPLLALSLSGCVTSPTEHAGHEGGAADLTAMSEDATGLPASSASRVVALADGDTFALRAGLVSHDVGSREPVRMFAYNGQIPGPTLRVPQGARAVVELTNGLPYETTVHWHGLRLAASSDGVPHLSQDPVAPGASFRYELSFPDEGVFWYHPHVREDAQQDLGLAGLILVEGPRVEGEARPRELVAVVDDLLVDEDGALAPFYEEAATHAVMGRFGNRFLVNGSLGWRESAAPGERVRVHLANVANARPLNLVFAGAERVDLIGLDGGFLTEPTRVESVRLAPSERATVDVTMPPTGNVRLLHVAAGREAKLGILVADANATGAFTGLAPAGPHVRARESLAPALALARATPTVNLSLDVAMPDMGGMAGMDHGGGMEPAPIEWEDEMGAEMSALTTRDVTWRIRDDATGRTNEDIRLEFAQGSLVQIRIRNPAMADHPMQHPIHFHGQRFLVQSIDGEPNPLPAWKDTVLVPAGSSVVLTLEASNPGTWVVHCHVSEHLEAGMEARFVVA